MSGYGLTYKTNMCYPNFIAWKFVVISIFKNMCVCVHARLKKILFERKVISY